MTEFIAVTLKWIGFLLFCGGCFWLLHVAFQISDEQRKKQDKENK